MLQRYQRHLYHAVGRNGKPLSIQSQCNRLTAIRTWFRFLMRENLILYNPASEMELPKREKRLPKHTLTAEEAEQVMNQPRHHHAGGLERPGHPGSVLLDRHPPGRVDRTGPGRCERLGRCPGRAPGQGPKRPLSCRSASVP